MTAATPLKKAGTGTETSKIVAVSLDVQTLSTGSAELEIERRRTIGDILDDNSFALVEQGKVLTGPYALSLSAGETDFTLNVAALGAGETRSISLTGILWQPVMLEYAIYCENFQHAARTGRIAELERIDQQKKTLQETASELLIAALKDRATLDIQTARRIFTLLHVLCMKNARIPFNTP